MPLIRARPKADHGYCCASPSILEARKEWGRFPTVTPISDWKRDFPLILGGEIRKSWLSLSRKKRKSPVIVRAAVLALYPNHTCRWAPRRPGKSLDRRPARRLHSISNHSETRFRLVASKASAGYLGKRFHGATSRIPSSPNAKII